jgi:hypothetical protein
MSGDEATREVLGAVKAAVPDIHMHTPVQHIVSAARSRRRRRGLTRLAVFAVAVAAGLALGLSAPGSGRSTPGAQPYGAKLAAWTARTGAGGAVTVTLRQLANAAALQHALAEHGVPAIVSRITRRSTNPCDHLAAVVVRQQIRDTCPPAECDRSRGLPIT